MRAICVQAQPGPAGGDSLAIPETAGVCNRFYALSRLLVCADPGHAPKYAKKRLEFLSLFCSAIAPAGMTWQNTDRRCHTVGGFPPFDSEGVMLFAPSFLGGGYAVEYITLILIIVLYTIIAIKK